MEHFSTPSAMRRVRILYRRFWSARMFVLGKMGMSRYLVVPSKTISEASRARETPHLRNKATEAVEQTSQGEQNLRTRRQTAETARQVRQPFINEQPLLAAALSFAAGAALAAILPTTEKEHEPISRASDAVKGTVGEAASES